MSLLPGADPFFFDAGEHAPAGVVLCHGFTGTPQSLRPWGEYLHAAGFTVDCPLLPGHGTTWREMNTTVWQDWYGALERAFDDMRERIQAPVFAMGLSMGGTLVTRLAELRGPELSGMVLVNPSYLTLRRGALLLPVARRVLRSLPPILSDIKRPVVREQGYDRIPVKAAHSLQQLWRTTRADLEKVTVPLQVYRSAIDHVVEPVNTRILLEKISSTDVAEIVLPNSYHVATLDNDAETIFAGSVEFVLDRLPRLSERDPSR